MTQVNITKESTMREIIKAYPNAQRFLFERYHVGGCGSCGYQPEDTLESVAHHHSKKMRDIDEVITFIKQEETDVQLKQVTPQQVKESLKSNSPPHVIDVRTSEEWNLANIKDAQLVNEELTQKMMKWPRNTAIVFFCHHGQRSLDAVSYFAGHGFTNVKSMTGGIDVWSLDIDPSVPRYEIAQSDSQSSTEIRSLRSVVSQEAGCRK
jgi:rhodanese-related sulfurtransferase